MWAKYIVKLVQRKQRDMTVCRGDWRDGEESQSPVPGAYIISTGGRKQQAKQCVESSEFSPRRGDRHRRLKNAALPIQANH
jgi:hypothetical protein